MCKWVLKKYHQVKSCRPYSLVTEKNAVLDATPQCVSPNCCGEISLRLASFHLIPYSWTLRGRTGHHCAFPWAWVTQFSVQRSLDGCEPDQVPGSPVHTRYSAQPVSTEPERLGVTQLVASGFGALSTQIHALNGEDRNSSDFLKWNCFCDRWSVCFGSMSLNLMW